MSMTVHAVIDIGSNSVLMLLGRRLADGTVEVHEDRAQTTRLSEGAAQTGRLGEQAIARTLAALRTCVAAARSAGAQPLVVATEGVRLADNPNAFLEPAGKIVGAAVRLLSGEEEARLSYESVAVELGSSRIRVLDIGGASTELVEGQGLDLLSSRSHAMGSVRLTEALADGDPPSAAAVLEMRAAARARFAEQPLTPWPELHGLAGTITSLGAIALGLEVYDRERVDNTRIGRERVASLLAEMATMTCAQRIARTLLPAKRADVFVAGLCIALEAMDHCGASTLVVRDRGHRYALLGSV